MSTAVRKIVVILTGIILIPIIVFTALEIHQVKENEKMMQEIYLRQLEAVLFSINQYSNDVFTGFANKLEVYNPKRTSTEMLTNMVSDYKGVLAVHFRDVNSDSSFTIKSRENQLLSNILDEIEGGYEKEKERLVRYQRANFMKIEPIQSTYQNDDVYLLAFVIEPAREHYYFCIAVISGLEYLETFLVPKVQQVADEGFVIRFTQINQSAVVYQTGEPEQEKFYAKTLWLLPNYMLEISIKGETIESIVAERSRFNLMVIGGVTILLIMGAWLIFRNIKKEVQLAQTKSDFVSNVSHEIRTPLALISMFAETLLMGRAKSEAKKMEYYDIIVKETSRLRNIVNKILNFSQIEANKKQYHKQTQSLNQIVDEVLNTYSFHLQNKGFEFSLELADYDLPINADREAITEAIINLLDNAIKYSPNEKEIVIRTARTGKYGFVSVKDIGVGIDRKKKSQIFDKFYRVTDGDIYKVQGAGLGLSIVKHIMDAHDGTIEVDSEPGKGSTFKLIFPLDQNKA